MTTNNRVVVLSCLIFFALAIAEESTAQQIGDIDTVGFTWYDQQRIGGGGRSVCCDLARNLHVVWTNGLSMGATERHVYYNYYFQGVPFGWFLGINGVPVDLSVRAGYADLAVDSHGYPFIAFQVRGAANPRAHAAVAVDFFPGAGVFWYWECPQVFAGGDELELIWPSVALDQIGRIHLVNTENPSTPGDSMRIYYCRGTYDPMLSEMEFIDQHFVDWVQTPGTDVAAGRHSDRVAFVYAHPMYVNGNHHGDDVYLVISEDGVTWDFSHPINVTDFILPDSAGQNGDTLTAFGDCSLLLDDMDDIHVAFTTVGRNQPNPCNSMIWHWTEVTGYYSLVADGWYGNVQYACGVGSHFVQRPCLAVEETSRDLFITYQQHDTADIAPDGIARPEVMVSRAMFDGVRWSVGTNVSNTHWRNDDVTFSYCERDITCNETVEQNALHLSYLGDLAEEGWSRNPVCYHRVPVNQIPETPYMPIFPLHIDSTGMPPEFYPLSVTAADNRIPDGFHLRQNYPNPFNAVTSIHFYVPYSTHVRVSVYNILGEKMITLLDKDLNPGTHTVLFDGTEFSSGVYFYEMVAGNSREVKKAILLR